MNIQKLYLTSALLFGFIGFLITFLNKYEWSIIIIVTTFPSIFNSINYRFYLQRLINNETVIRKEYLNEDNLDIEPFDLLLKKLKYKKGISIISIFTGPLSLWFSLFSYNVVVVLICGLIGFLLFPLLPFYGGEETSLMSDLNDKIIKRSEEYFEEMRKYIRNKGGL